MSKIAPVVLVMVLVVFSVFVSDAEAVVGGDTVIDKVGDWFAVLGKPQDEKDIICAQRRAARLAERMRKEAEEGMKEFDRKMKKALGR